MGGRGEGMALHPARLRLTGGGGKVRRERPELGELLRNAANEIGCPVSPLLCDFVKDGSELILNDTTVARELRRKYEVL